LDLGKIDGFYLDHLAEIQALFQNRKGACIIINIKHISSSEKDPDFLSYPREIFFLNNGFKYLQEFIKYD